MARYSCGLIGCGPRGASHAKAINASGRFELVALCDRNVENAHSLAAEYDVSAVSRGIEEMFRAEHPDHVSVVTAPGDRLPIVETVSERAPKSALLEKPVANTLSDVEAIADLLRHNETMTTVCHQKPYSDEFQAVKRWIRNNTFGTTERLIASTKGGLTGQGTHLVHALNWLVGDQPTDVRGYAEGPVPLDPAANPRVDDHSEPEDAVLELTYPADIRAYLHLGPNAPAIPEQSGSFWYEFRVDVIGSDGRAELVLGDHAKCITSDGMTVESARAFEEDLYMTRTFYDDIAAVLAGEMPTHLGNLKSAVTVHRTIDAAMRSALDGRCVNPKEQPLDVGTSTSRRLRRRLISRLPPVFSTAMFGQHSRQEALRALHALGASHIDLWTDPETASHVYPDPEEAVSVREDLEDLGLSVPIMSIGQEDVERRVRFAEKLGATTVVFSDVPSNGPVPDVGTISGWMDAADDRGLTGCIVPGIGAPAELDAVIDLLTTLDHPAAHVGLALPPLLCTGATLEEAFVRLGDRIDIVYLWDTEPVHGRGRTDPWWAHPDSQVLGSGSALDVELLQEMVLKHAPTADLVIRFHGVDDWTLDRTAGAIRRGIRHLEATRR